MADFKIISLLNQSPFILMLSLNLDLNEKLELEEKLSKLNCSLSFVSSKKLLQTSSTLTAYSALSGIANGNLYFITSRTSLNLIDSHRDLNMIFVLLKNYNPIIYGLRWNSLLYTSEEILSLENRPLINNHPLNRQLISCLYSYICFILLLRNHSLNLNSFTEEIYVYN